MGEVKTTLIDVSQMQEAIGLRGRLGRSVARLAMKWLEIDKLNEMQSRLCGDFGPEFAEKVLAECGVSYDIDPAQLERIPAEGAFITVSNHPIGSLDGLILAAAIGARRPDYKIMTTYFLTLIPGLKDYFIPVDNFRSGNGRSINGLRAAITHIESGSPLGLFPAGEVSTWQRGKNKLSVGDKRIVEDIPWAHSAVKIASKAGVPVIPVYFDGENSKSFHRLGRIHPRLRTARLIHEMLNKRGTCIKVRIGKAILPSEIANYSVEELGRYLRSRTYALQAQCLPGPEAAVHEWKTAVAPAVPSEKIIAEMEKLDDKILFEACGYRVYLIKSQEAPNAMQEIYRLREEAFRAIGEGTGTESDSDEYDLDYRQMILWQIENKEIAGAYRIGFCGEIIRKYGGIQGVYSASLFRYSKEAEPILSSCMELGRSFISLKYQKELHPLRMLFAGLIVSALQCPEAQYFIGPVSISNDYPDFYKSLAYHYLLKVPPFEDCDQYIGPSHPFKPDFLAVNPDDLMGHYYEDVDKFNRLVSTISDGKYKLPVLIRKYFNCSGKIGCFNVDPLFSNSLDGLIFVHFPEFTKDQFYSFLRGLPEDLIKKVSVRFYGEE